MGSLSSRQESESTWLLIVFTLKHGTQKKPSFVVVTRSENALLRVLDSILGRVVEVPLRAQSTKFIVVERPNAETCNALHGSSWIRKDVTGPPASYIDQHRSTFEVYSQEVKDAVQSPSIRVLLLGKCHMTQSQRDKTMSLIGGIPVVVVYLRCEMKQCIKRCLTREKGSSSLDDLSRPQVEHVVRTIKESYEKIDSHERRRYFQVVTVSTTKTHVSETLERLREMLRCNMNGAAASGVERPVDGGDDSFVLQRRSTTTMWDKRTNGLEIFAYLKKTKSPAEKIRLACFDLDNTLIQTKSGKLFPADQDDWQWCSNYIKQMLHQYHRKGYEIVVLTNQAKGATRGFEHIKQKIEKVCKDAGIPILVLMSVGMNSRFRKPKPGFMKYLSRIYNDQISTEDSFYVGDAAGREGDFSDCDKVFARNAGLKFYTNTVFFRSYK